MNMIRSHLSLKKDGAGMIQIIKYGIKNELCKNYQLYLLMVLPVVWLIIFAYIPMYGVTIAFKNFRAVDGIIGSPWAEPLFKYFIKFINSYQFSNVMKNTVIISLYSLLAGFPVPIIIALALNNTESAKFRKLVQMSSYAPYFISTVVVVGMMMQFLSVQDYGIVNNIIKALGGEPILFMGKPEYFYHVYVWSSIWQGAGWGAIIYIAALSSIEQELYEAAIVDGASKFQRVLHIDIPGIMPTVVIMLILSMGQFLNVGFEKIFIMQNPQNMSNAEVISTFVYKIGFLSGLPDYSYSSAIGLFNNLINFVLLVTVNQLSKKVNSMSLF